MYPKDTIAAIATPLGMGGIGIIRVSGNNALQIAYKLTGIYPKPRFASYCNFLDQHQATIDQGIILYFQAPNSFTGEEVIEIQAHGGKVIMQILLARLLELGTRLADPGEFSKRAYLNDKIDLLQSEAINSLIHAGSSAATKAAMRSLSGNFSNEVEQLQRQLIKLRTYVEASIDFPEEEATNFIKQGMIQEQLQTLLEQVTKLVKQGKQGEILTSGVNLIIVGQPNVGKSSLFNTLAQNDIAIVTDQAGTTRDLIKQTIELDGLVLNLIDTAGIRTTQQQIEQIGIDKAITESKLADLILLVIDATKGISKQDLEILHKVNPDSSQDHTSNSNTNCIIVFNKIDKLDNNKLPDLPNLNLPSIAISTIKKIGLDRLQQTIQKVAGYETDSSISSVSIRSEHMTQLALVQQSITTGLQHLITAPELLAEELHIAQESLNKMLKKHTSDELLTEIFSNFCLGK